jgi:hypothetical protein
MRVTAFLIVLTVTLPGVVSAQSLADVARQETDRRQVVKSSGKSYTNADLKPVPEPPAAKDTATASGEAAAPGADSAADAAAADASKAEPADGGKKADVPKDAAAASTGGEERTETWWRKQMADLREQLARDETFRDALQTRIDSLTMDFVNRDDPAQRSQIQADRQKALSELDRMKKTIEKDKQAIPDLEDDARRAGVPAGWLR